MATLANVTTNVQSDAQRVIFFARDSATSATHTLAYRSGNFDDYTIQSLSAGSSFLFSPVDAGAPAYTKDLLAYSYDSTGGAVYSNGTQVTTSSGDLSTVGPTDIQLYLGGGYYQSLKYYNRRYDNTQAQLLSTP